MVEKLPQDLLEILACPNCKGDLEYDEKKNILICRNCKVYYEIIEGIPNLIWEEAKPLEVLKEKTKKD
jgi:uncharacterized protein YbaR (Trm112 family)